MAKVAEISFSYLPGQIVTKEIILMQFNKNWNLKNGLTQRHLWVHMATLVMEAISNIHTLHLTPKHNLS